MERAVVVGGPTVPAVSLQGYDRVYFGPEFCGELLPSADELEAALEVAERAAVAFTLVTPPASQRQVEMIRRLCELLPAGAEVVVNDVGVLWVLPDTLDEHGDDALHGDGFGTRRGCWSPVSAVNAR